MCAEIVFVMPLLVAAIYRMRAVADIAGHTLNVCVNYMKTNDAIKVYLNVYFYIFFKVVLIVFLRVRLNETNKQTTEVKMRNNTMMVVHILIVGVFLNRL